MSTVTKDFDVSQAAKDVRTAWTAGLEGQPFYITKPEHRVFAEAVAKVLDGHVVCELGHRYGEVRIAPGPRPAIEVEIDLSNHPL